MTSPTPIVPDQGDTFARRYAESLVDWGTFWDAEFQVAEWCIEPILPQGRSIAIYSPGGAGKSLFLLDVLARAATGRRVLERRAGKPLRVLYFDLEMTEGDLLERLEAMGYGRESDLSRLFYYLLPNLPPLDTAAGGEAVVALAREHEADIVVIDTTSRVISGKENDSDTVLAFYRHTGRPLKELGCTVVRLDHAGKDLDRGQRGTSAKNDDVDLIWELRAKEGGIALHAKKRRQSWIPEHVDLIKREEPLSHELAVVGSTWPAGTQACAESLDRLDAPLDITTRAARQLLQEHGGGARTEVLSAALKYRRHVADQGGSGRSVMSADLGNTSGNTFSEALGNNGGEQQETDSETLRETSGNTPHGDWETPPLTSEGGGSHRTLCSICQNNPADEESRNPDRCVECQLRLVNALLDTNAEESDAEYEDDWGEPPWDEWGDAP